MQIRGYFLLLLFCSVAGCSAGFCPCFSSDLGCPPFAMIALHLHEVLLQDFPH